MTGHGMVSWTHIDDVANATADALDRGRGGQIYNIVDDRPQSFGDYVRELSANCIVRAHCRSRTAGRTGRLLSGDSVRRHLAAAVERQGQGRARLDAYSPVKCGVRFSNIAVMPSVRSFDGRNAEFQTAT